MPKPIYIICADSIVEDRTTNRISFFNVIERVRIAKLKEGEKPEPQPTDPLPFFNYLNLVAVAVWEREDGDPGPWDWEFLIQTPNKEVISATGEHFDFSPLPAKPLHRVRLNLTLSLAQTSGTMEITCRIKRHDKDGPWYRQSYRIAVDAISGEGDE